MTRSVARSLCDSWASCYVVSDISPPPATTITRRYR